MYSIAHLPVPELEANGCLRAQGGVVFERGRLIIQHINVFEQYSAALPIELDDKTIWDEPGLNILKSYLLHFSLGVR